MLKKVQMETILITDDDRVCREAIQRTLERQGYRVQGAEDVDAALDAIRRIPFDLIVCDFRMPGKTGLDLLAELHARGPQIPVLMVSAYTDANTEAAAVQLGAAGLLRKPFRRQDLLDCVERAIH
jgi:DNA-binding NtrC family response regulator